MRQVTQKTSQAFKNGEDYKNNNTVVKNNQYGTVLKLHNNIIASLTGNNLYIDNCGWKTKITKERLNGILEVFNLGKIVQKKGEWFLNNELFNRNQEIKI